MSKKRAIIVDLDGTLSNCEHRVHHVQKEPKDWVSFHSSLVEDKLNNWCHTLINAMLKDDVTIILLTGRDEKYRDLTLGWLERHAITFEDLHMRPDEDRRSDHIVKKDIYHNSIKEDFDILFVLEDRKSVVQMWRDEGITCLHCDWGEF